MVPGQTPLIESKRQGANTRHAGYNDDEAQFSDGQEFYHDSLERDCDEMYEGEPDDLDGIDLEQEWPEDDDIGHEED